MAIVWILLWVLAIIILIKDSKTESTVWLAIGAFFGGLGAFTVVFEEVIMKYLIAQFDLSQAAISSLHLIDAILMTVVYSTVPYALLIYGLTYIKISSKSKRKMIYTVLAIPPILSFILLPMRSNYLRSPDELLLFFRQLSMWSVPYILMGIIFLFYSYFTEKSYMMKRFKLLNIIIVVPCFIYTILSNFIFRAFGIENNWRNFIVLIPLLFVGFLYFAFKYGILGVRLKFDRHKFAFENIIELVSDSILMLDESLRVIEFNKEFAKNFLVEDKKYVDLEEITSSSRLSEYKEALINIVSDSKAGQSEAVELLTRINDEIKYFEVQANPIILNEEYLGTVLVFKDITIHKKNLELIKENQLQMMEKERLLSLSQLIGGVAHNLKTPLLGSSGGIQIIKRDTGKIEDYIQENCGKTAEITKLVNEVNDWQQRITEYLIYMSDVISVVKGQVVQYSEKDEDQFSIKELVEKTTLLMAFEIKKSKCVFAKEINIDPLQMIQGDVNSLVQVLNNLITNALEASCEGNTVTLGIEKSDGKVVFFVRNFGHKIPEEIQGKIFNEMITTKGKNGTGLGLYISKSIIKVRFNGEVYFDTNDEETTFFIKTPLTKEEHE